MGAFDDLTSQQSTPKSGTFDDLVPNAPIPKSGNILQQAASAIADSNRQAQAGASEFLRNPMGASDSYMKGFNNPQGSETFSNQFQREQMQAQPELMDNKNTIPAFFRTLPSNLMGSTLDTMANPLQAASSAAIGKYAEPVMQGIGKGASAVGQGIADSPVGKFFGGIGDTFKGAGNVLTKSSRLNYMDKMEDAVYQARSEASPKFGQALADITAKNPGKSVDMSQIGQNLSTSDDPIIQRALSKSPELQNIATHPTGQIPLQDAQDALNSLKTQLPKNVLSGAGKRSMHLPVMDMVDDMSMAMSKDFPEIQGAREAYGQTVNDFRSIRPKVAGDAAEHNLFGSQGLLDFQGKPFMGGERSEQAFKNLVGPENFKEAIGTNRASKIGDFGKKTLLFGPAEEFIRRKFFNQH